MGKGLFIAAHELGFRGFRKLYQELCENQWKPYELLKEEQDAKLQTYMKYVYDTVPYYHSLLNSLKLEPTDIKTTEDLEKLPILTKDIIRKNWEAMIPKNLQSIKYENHSSGGTTGTPFRYRLSWNSRFTGGALLYRGWNHGGFELGDKMIFLAGSSIGMDSKSAIIKKAYEITRNLRKLSAFDMSDENLRKYAKTINSFKPLYIRGYASAINAFATWIHNNNITLPPIKAVFTTSEMLYPYMRENISSVFGCDVFDNYGLNDGGVSAFECQEHQGLHIDMERSVMEVVDESEHQLKDGEGRILATDLTNYAMPFIRYETGDEAEITSEKCSCGRGLPLLKTIIGRTTDMLITPDGTQIHGWLLLLIFWEYDTGIKEYQVVQNSIDKLDIKLVVAEDFNEKMLDTISDLIHKRAAGWDIDYSIVDAIDRTKSGKYKYIINNI